jgi:hypothetical protein
VVSEFVPDFGAVKSVIVEDFDGSALRSFKDCHRGERCFIIGNGPSLKRTDLAPLADEITIGVNGIFYMTQQCGFAPTYYVVEDNHVFSDDLVRVNNVDAVAKFFPSKYRPIITPGPDVHFLPTDWSFYWGSSPWYETPRFSHDIADVIYVGQTVTFLNIQLAAYMGFSEIYLVGVDFDYQIPEAAKIDGLTITSVDDDPNHFHPDYFGKGKKWHLPKLENVEKAMVCAQDGVKESGATIFNATVGGKLETFPRIDYHELLGRPQIPEPNAAAHFMLTRALARAAVLGAKTVAVDPLTATPAVAAIIAASPLRLVEDADADVVVAASYRHGSDAGTVAARTLVLPAGDDGDSHAAGPTREWFERLIVEGLVTGRAAFWSRSMLELSPDGESVVVPALGRTAHGAPDPHREFGVEAIGNLDGSAATRWARGRSLSIDAISDLAAELAEHRHSVAVVDGYVYVQSRWKPTEQPKELWATRQAGAMRGRREE